MGKIKLFQKHESPKFKDRIKQDHSDLLDLLLGSQKWEYDEIHVPKNICCEYCEELVKDYNLKNIVVY